MAGLPELSAKLARTDPQQMYFLLSKRILEELRRLDDIQRSFFSNHLSCKQKAECICWYAPFRTNSVTFAAGGSGRGRKSRIVYAIWRGNEPALTDTLLQVELPISLADVQEAVDTVEKFAQQSAFELSPDPACVAARIRFPSEPYFSTCLSRSNAGRIGRQFK